MNRLVSDMVQALRPRYAVKPTKDVEPVLRTPQNHRTPPGQSLLFTKNHRWIDLSTGMSGISYLYFNEMNPTQLKFYPPVLKLANELGLLLIRDQERLDTKHLKMFEGRVIDVNMKPETKRDLIWLYRIAQPKVNESELMDFDTYMAWNHSIEN